MSTSVRPGDEAASRPTGAGAPGAGEVEGAVVVLPTHEDPLARSASPVVGGPAGRRVRTRRHPLRSALAVGSGLGLVVLAVGVLLRQHCRETLWATPGQYVHACYSDVPTLFSSRYLDAVVPYLQRRGGTDFLEVPFGTGWLLWGLGRLVGVDRGAATGGRDVFDATVVLGAAALVVLVAAVVALSGRRPWDAVLVGASPVVLVCALVGVPLVPAALAVAGLWASARGRALGAGVLVGLAALLAPVLGLATGGALLLVRARRRRDEAAERAAGPQPSAAAGPGDDLDGEQEPPARALDPELRTAVAAVVVWVLGGLPVLLENPGTWVDAVTTRVLAGPGYGSVWLVAGLLGAEPSRTTTTVVSLLLLVVLVLAVVVLVLRAPRAPRVPVVALLLLVAALVTSPALPPQAAVLVLPLAVLAVPGWRLLLAWGAVEAAAATGTWLYLYGLQVHDRGLPPWAYAVLVLLRLGALLVLAARAVEVTTDPGCDVVRAPRSDPLLGTDDPALPRGRRTPAVPGPAPG
ncbi:hypothetical protein WDZ17_10835 [Pseudokineococcus basanitobsidens]|uniref:DUF2029 domain-containing protein n=1 Tax=Pseudokineococcus basanitobsidens TaxID=1926649 RepID=A0ABU8RL59_9ACTN